jgi:hypothetical protein
MSNINTIFEKLVTVDNLRIDEIELVKQLERKFYNNSDMWFFQDMESIDDIKDYVENYNSKDIKIHIDDNKEWYILISEFPNKKTIEVVDMAGNFGSTLIKKVEEIFSKYTGWIVKADLRETTSYRLLIIIKKKQKIKMIRDSEWDWSGDNMHEVIFKIL